MNMTGRENNVLVFCVFSGDRDCAARHNHLMFYNYLYDTVNCYFSGNLHKYIMQFAFYFVCLSQNHSTLLLVLLLPMCNLDVSLVCFLSLTAAVVQLFISCHL